MRLSRIFVAAIALAGCTDMQTKRNDETSGESAAKSSCEDKTCNADPETPKAVDGLGLGDLCVFAANAGKGCFTCTPRELPNTLCVAVPSDFDPTKKCQHDLDRLTCDLGGADAFTFEFADRTPDEDVYEELPLFVMGAKFILTNKLKDKPELRDMVFKVLDSVATHRLAIFKGEDIGAIADDARPLMLSAKKELTDAEFGQIKSAMQDAVKAFAAQRAAGPVTFADGFAVVSKLYQALRPSLFGPELDAKAFYDIVNSLKGKSQAEVLKALTDAVGGDEAMVALLAQMGLGAASDSANGAQ